MLGYTGPRNFGRGGGRLCFLGVGGEVVVAEEAPTDTPALSRIQGIGAEFWMVKFKYVWK